MQQHEVIQSNWHAIWQSQVIPHFFNGVGLMQEARGNTTTLQWRVQVQQKQTLLAYAAE